MEMGKRRKAGLYKLQREQRQGRVRSWEGSGLVTEGGVVDSADKTEGHFWKRETHIHFSEPGHLAFCPLRPALKTTNDV